jgi:hypothetical protein
MYKVKKFWGGTTPKPNNDLFMILILFIDIESLQHVKFRPPLSFFVYFSLSGMEGGSFRVFDNFDQIYLSIRWAMSGVCVVS